MATDTKILTQRQREFLEQPFPGAATTLRADGSPQTTIYDASAAYSEAGVPLVVLESPYRSLMEPLLEYVEQVATDRPADYVTVVLPEFVPAKWWHHLFHNQRALLIKGALLFKPNVVVTSVPFHLRR